MKVLCILFCVAFASGFYIRKRDYNNGIHEDNIIGGDSVGIEDVPYLASLLWFKTTYLCGATIIHESWVITAAHCVANKRNIFVITGTGLRKTLGKGYRVEKIIMHEYFESNAGNNNDIALIMLVRPIQFSNKQQPIEIAKPQDISREGELMRISGFGKTGPHMRNSDVLKTAHVHVVNQEDCERVYRSDPITNNMFCAGNGNPDVAAGDSGGPGVIHGKLYGIISTYADYEPRIFPGVYTRVHKYYDWIVEKTGHRF